jgi:ATP:ADP antiporter, AAA family
MVARFFSAFKFRSMEQKQIVLMLCTGFFMGVFIATYQVTVDSMFLNRMGDQLNKAFLIAGALGMVSTMVFSFFQARLNFTSIALASVVLILAFTLSAYWLLRESDPKINYYLIFALYTMSGPITAVLLLSFWGIFGRLFNFRQSKRIIGWIDTGQLIAAIIATLIFIPLTSNTIGDTSNYLLVCAVSITIVSILLFIIASSFNLYKNNPREMGLVVRRETRWSRLVKDKYILTLGLFLLVSMVTFVLNQYSFQTLVKEQYPNERELTNFNSFFTGAVYGISLIMQTFVNHRIINNYGLRVSLFLLPFILGLFSIGSLVVGNIFGFEKAVTATGFIYFFLFISLNRLLNWILRDSLENPVFKLFFIPLESRVRFNIQSKIEGVVNEGSRFLAGLLIFTLGFLPFFNLMHVLTAVFVLSLLYFFVVNRMYQGYRNKIRLKLESTDVQQDKLEKGFTRITGKLQEQLNTQGSTRAVFSFKLLEKINATRAPYWLNNLIRNTDEATRHFANEKVNELKGLSVSDRYVVRINSEKAEVSGKNILSQADLMQLLQNGGEISKSRIRTLARSNDPDERQYAAELLLHTAREENTSFLLELLHDSVPKVRGTAINTSVKKDTHEVINAVIENLSNPLFSNQAMNALLLMGQDTLSSIDAAFYRSGQSTHTMLKLIQVIGRIGGQRAREILWNKIDYPNKVIVSQVLVSLGECGFKAGVSQITRIKYAIESDISDVSWNISAIQEVADEGFGEAIKASLRSEIHHDIEHIYMLLTMLYDTRSIQLVKENIDSGTTEGITYAIELLDVFLSDQLKQRVIPLLDDLTDSERVSRLEYFYPRVKLDSKLVLKFLINRDFTQSNRWTKSCVVFQIGILHINDFKLDLIAHLFNPDPLLREVSAWALFQIDDGEYHTNTRRLGDSSKRELDALIIHSQRMMRFEKVLFFQKLKIFDQVPGVVLAALADISEETRMTNGSVVTLDEKGNNYFYVLVNGVVDYYYKGEVVKQFTEGQFVGEMVGLPNFVNTNLLIAKSDVIIIRFHKDQFYELLSDNVKLADQVLASI